VAILGMLISLCSLVCWIIVEVKIFQSGNILMGVLGICPLVAFIYGLVKSKELDIQKIMLIWTGLIVLSIIFNAAFGTTMIHTTRTTTVSP
jgi:hypothetical protein